MKVKILRLALEKQDYNLAAHAIVFGMVKAKVKDQQDNGKKRSSTGESKRP